MPEVEDANDYEQSDDQDNEHNSEAEGDNDQEDMPIMCCVCRKVKTADDAWIEPEEIIPEEVHVSHGFCPPCAVVEWDKIFRRRAAATFPILLGGDTAAQNSPLE